MTTRISSLKVLAGAALVSTAAMAQAASVLVNGDFQANSLNGWTSYVTTNGVITANGGSVVTPAVAATDLFGGTANLAAQLNVGKVQDTAGTAGGGLKQTFTIGTTGQYKLFADIASAGNKVYDNADGGTFSLLIDGNQVASYAFGQLLVDTPERSTLSGLVNLTAGSHEIRLQAVRSYITSEYTPFQYFDNVSITAAVPEAGTHALMLIGLGLLGGVHTLRRRQQR